ncbi:MAG: ECF transporter S component [Lachnospiraceae bacterium]|nr:ECF transporter S component [Lachnospiraceae bacterium]
MKEKTKTNMSNTQKRVLVGIFSALAAVLMYLEIPFFFAPSVYQLDFSEVPALIASFLLGPVAGVVTECMKILIKLIIKPTSTAFVGEFANLVVGITFVLPASLIYKKKRTRTGAVAGMGVGTLSMTVIGCLVNAFILLPAFAYMFGDVPISEIIKLGTAVNPAITDMVTFIILAVAPVNIIKGIVVSLVVFFIYKPVTKGIRSIVKSE